MLKSATFPQKRALSPSVFISDSLLRSFYSRYHAK
jgi:hypothetical protein